MGRVLRIGPKVRSQNEGGVSLIEDIGFRPSILVRDMETDQTIGGQLMADCDLQRERRPERADEDGYEMGEAKTGCARECVPL